jgi:hypothetical protein
MHDPEAGNQQGREMHVNEIKAMVRGDTYVVDPQRVAAALLRRCVPLGALSRRDARGRAAAPPRPPRET